MAVLGLLLLLCATGLTLDVVFQNTASINVDAVGQTFTLSSGWLFVAAVATGAVGLLGVTTVLGGIARARHRRAILTRSRGTTNDPQTDRDRLAAELDCERAGRTSTAYFDSDPERLCLFSLPERRNQPMTASDKAKNNAQNVKGTIKETVGKATGNDRLRREGKTDKMEGDYVVWCTAARQGRPG